MANPRFRFIRRVLLLTMVCAPLACAASGGCQNGDDDDDDDASSYDLVITEVMADPDATPDAVGEWVEICTPGDALEIASSEIQIAVGAGGLAKSIASPDTLVFDPCLVFKEHGTGEPASLGDAVAVDGMQSIGNDGSLVCLTTAAGAEIDCVTTGVATTGKSWALCGDQIDAEANDDDAHWFTDETNACCESGDGTADYGTPGVWNDTPAACAGGDDDDTTDEPVDIPYGTLVIAEVMADPQASGDNAGEWFEVCAPDAPQVIDLADVNVVNDGVVKEIHEPAEVTFDPCLSFAKHRDDMSGTPAALLDGVLVDSLGSLPQSGGTLCLRTVDGDDIDCADYPAATTGSSNALSWDALDADLNDSADAWCLDEVHLYDGADIEGGDTGTPGQANDVCAD